MKDELISSINENLVIENTFCIEDVRFSLLFDRGFLNLQIKTTVPYNINETVPIHFHSFYEISYCDSPMYVIFEDKKVLYSEGYLFIIPPGVKHAQKRPFQRPNPNLLANLTFNMKKLSHSSDIPLYDILAELLKEPVAFKAPPRVGEIIAVFDSSHPNSVSGDKLSMSMLFHELITIILKTAVDDGKVGKAGNVTDSNTSRAYKINMIINNHFSGDITIEQVAKKMKMSTRQVSRIINTMYGKPYRELIAELRMKRAGKLLHTTDMNISEISSTVGYNAVKGFYNAFKKYYGCLPTDYRKNNTQTKEVNTP